jgi:hypothetical protein
VRFPRGSIFGEPGNAEKQRKVLKDVLEAAYSITGPAVADVKKGLGEFVALGIAAQCGRDGSPWFALTASPDARRTIESLL